jgi:hypothetical protein
MPRPHAPSGRGSSAEASHHVGGIVAGSESGTPSHALALRHDVYGGVTVVCCEGSSAALLSQNIWRIADVDPAEIPCAGERAYACCSLAHTLPRYLVHTGTAAVRGTRQPGVVSVAAAPACAVEAGVGVPAVVAGTGMAGASVGVGVLEVMRRGATGTSSGLA